MFFRFLHHSFCALSITNLQHLTDKMHAAHGSVLWIGFSVFLLLSCISHTHTFVPIILLVFGAHLWIPDKILCLIHFSLACLLCLFCIYSFSSDVCNSNWKFDASKCERRFTAYYVFQGARYYSIHRLSLGGNDYDASQGHSVMAFNSTLSWLFFYHFLLCFKTLQIWDKFSCNYVLMLCFVNYNLIQITIFTWLQDNSNLRWVVRCSTASLNWTLYDSHITHDMLPQHQINITKYITECFKL